MSLFSQPKKDGPSGPSAGNQLPAAVPASTPAPANPPAPTQAPAPSSTSTALTQLVCQYPDLPGDVLEILEGTDNMESVLIPRVNPIKIIHETQMFYMPDESTTKEIRCVILDVNRINSYWEKKLTEGGAMGSVPDCWSFDGLMPASAVEKPISEDCVSCPFNKFGSDGNRGKKCKNQVRMHLLLSQYPIPIRFNIPATSLKDYEKFMTSLTAINKVLYCLARIKISLSKRENKDGVIFSGVVFELLNVIEDKNEIIEIAELRKKVVKTLRNAEITTDEVSPDEPF